MLAYQAIFKRYELKYLLTLEQKNAVLAAMQPHMALDQYGRTTIRNLYYDTDTYLLIRRSIEKPVYKEKLRVRTYGQADEARPIFVELKKKYDSVVYKRRISMDEQDAMRWLAGQASCPREGQIPREISYFLRYYGTLQPRVFLTYEREAYYALDHSDFRVTFDDHALARTKDLSLRSAISGIPLLPEGMILMELKCSGGLPLWMTEALTRERIRKASFSKYGTAYQKLILPYATKEVFRHDAGFAVQRAL